VKKKQEFRCRTEIDSREEKHQNKQTTIRKLANKQVDAKITPGDNTAERVKIVDLRNYKRQNDAESCYCKPRSDCTARTKAKRKKIEVSISLSFEWQSETILCAMHRLMQQVTVQREHS